jgi:hypothetical protein
MTTQIIHCPTDAAMRKEGLYGTTWIVREDAVSIKHVHVQYSICSPDDQFSRKKGVAVAKFQTSFKIHKADLLNIGSNLSSKHLKPSLEQIYLAMVCL